MIFEIPSTGLRVMLRETLGAGEWEIEFEGEGEGDLDARIRASGTLPLPPYIRNEDAPLDRYQTVYADRDGSIAAPTAGLHFSEELIASLRQSGIHFGKVTLHVGAGTFKPVSADRIQDHHMHAEWGEVPEETATLVGETHARGGRVVAVGTTSSRLLESAWRDGAVRTFTGDTSLFIYPGYRFRAIDGLVTNFHLPRSTLLMLISALAGRERVLHAYEEAVRLRYRFYSFGDAMLIL
jgi:S-adenosylmethionine:tRNA ribosyltransferase-isomerase